MHKNLQEMEMGRFKFCRERSKCALQIEKNPFMREREREITGLCSDAYFFYKYCCDVYLILLFWLVEEIREEKKMQNKFGGVPPRKRKK